jgi:hypothetical protein
MVPHSESCGWGGWSCGLSVRTSLRGSMTPGGSIGACAGRSRSSRRVPRGLHLVRSVLDRIWRAMSGVEQVLPVRQRWPSDRLRSGMATPVPRLCRRSMTGELSPWCIWADDDWIRTHRGRPVACLRPERCPMSGIYPAVGASVLRTASDGSDRTGALMVKVQRPYTGGVTPHCCFFSVPSPDCRWQTKVLLANVDRILE